MGAQGKGAVALWRRKFRRRLNSIHAPSRAAFLSGRDSVACFFPFLEAAEKGTRLRDPELSKRERRTGARFLSLSTAVRHYGFAQAS
jgi:hypothetical protein